MGAHNRFVVAQGGYKPARMVRLGNRLLGTARDIRLESVEAAISRVAQIGRRALPEHASMYDLMSANSL